MFYNIIMWTDFICEKEKKLFVVNFSLCVY